MTSSIELISHTGYGLSVSHTRIDVPTGLTIIGTPFSTFTRTIALGLEYKGLKYTQKATRPQTELALENHPYGYLPTLIIHTCASDGGRVDLKLRESQAIVRYIDRVAPEPSLQLKTWGSKNHSGGTDVGGGFPIIEGGVVKPRIKALDEGHLSDSEVRASIKSGVEETKKFLSLIESLVTKDGLYLFGKEPTWADFFLFPIIADLRMIPEWVDVATEKFINWAKSMDDLDAVKATKEGTLSVNARPD